VVASRKRRQGWDEAGAGAEAEEEWVASGSNFKVTERRGGGRELRREKKGARREEGRGRGGAASSSGNWGKYGAGNLLLCFGLVCVSVPGFLQNRNSTLAAAAATYDD
jgi:hypothetical protein